jgi:hypothetical protein
MIEFGSIDDNRELNDEVGLRIALGLMQEALIFVKFGYQLGGCYRVAGREASIGCRRCSSRSVLEAPLV